MLREMLRVKIHNATITKTELEYGGSITLDPAMLEKTGLLPYEKVEVLNLNNGARFQTFVIKGTKNTGQVCLNGPAARLGQPGDRVHILAYALVDEKEMKGFKTYCVYLAGRNKVSKVQVTGHK
jgi:aspartate 1-decarboxylase